MVAEQPPDLIVLDLGLPDLEGTEVCRRIRAHVDGADHRALGARRAKPTRCNALDLGADDYVTKPFGPEELLARIRVALRRVDVRRRRQRPAISAPATSRSTTTGAASCAATTRSG